MIDLEELQNRIVAELDMSREIEDAELVDVIREALDGQSGDAYISLTEKVTMGKNLFNAFRKLDILQEFLEDEDITEIMINGTDNIFIEKFGRLEKSDKRFLSLRKLEDVVQQIASGCNRIVNESTPILDARLKDGSRVNIVLPPVSTTGPVVTIRKFPKDAVTMERLLQWGALNEEMQEFLKKLVKAGYNIFISGGTGSGKTTFLNALSEYIPSDERIVTIEDSKELQINGIENLVSLETRNANTEGTGAVEIRDLIKTALRMRPNRIIVGEVRSAEAIDMLQAFNCGHDGSLSTGHANSPKDMLSRLETMVLMGMDIPLQAVQKQIASGIDIIIHLGRLRDKSRKVLQIVEVLGYENGDIRCQILYEFCEEKGKKERVYGKWKKRHELQNQTKLFCAGY